MNKIIKTETEYEAALQRLEILLTQNPDEGTPDSEALELVTLLIEDYESRHFQPELPDPIEAIKFRMEQQNLSPRDLIPFIGNRSKVSEVLSGKRPLTIPMIRSLSSKLGIPVSVLIQEKEEELDWTKFPIKQMVKWDWIKVPRNWKSIPPEKILLPFFQSAGTFDPQAVLFRSSSHVRSGRKMDEYALEAWAARVLSLASSRKRTIGYVQGTLNLEFLRDIARLSTYDNSPLVVIDYLSKFGITVIVERHLSGTYLDGAAIISNESQPVIGLTLRYDRLDHFWFTLMHELAHITLHMKNEDDFYFDDMDVDVEDDPREHEANRLASEALIPQEVWVTSPASRQNTQMAAEHLASKLNINIAIVAGRIQHEFKSYKILRNLVGSNQVRNLFPEVNWEAN